MTAKELAFIMFLALSILTLIVSLLAIRYIIKNKKNKE